jgi:hypothetical protein
MAPIRRLVLDVLKPHEPAMVELAQQLVAVDGVDGVNATVVEIDRKVENVKLTVEGAAIDYGAVNETIDEFGATIHSVDELAVGDHLVEAGETPQD